MRKGKSPIPELNETHKFECLEHSNWTICSPLSPFCSGNFQFVSSLYWEAISYYPRGLIMRKMKSPIPEMNETQGFECLGHSNWTISSPFSPFCSGNFQFVSSLYWEAISYYSRGLIVIKRKSPIPERNDTEGCKCLGHSNRTICSLLSHFVINLGFKWYYGVLCYNFLAIVSKSHNVSLWSHLENSPIVEEVDCAVC